MGLDISLTEIGEVGLYEGGTTHNLGKMAGKVSLKKSLVPTLKEDTTLYRVLWRPGELGFSKGSDLIVLLTEAVRELKSDPEFYKTFNSPNGWGMYEHFVPFVERYLNACKEYPKSLIEISR